MLLLLTLLVSCFPATREETGFRCWMLTNGDAETGDLSGWEGAPADAVEAVTSHDQQAGTVQPQEGSHFFSMARAPADEVTLTHACSPVPAMKACSLRGWFLSDASGDTPDTGLVRIQVLDEAGVLLNETEEGPHSSEGGAWEHFEVRGELAEGDATFQIQLVGLNNHGETVEVLWDDLSVSCDDGVSGAS
jgi:hypothetical protein